ncbi:MAG TPA: bifunctional oligoribonuclease/PAP phosphatase NrnA [Clostridiaceae bacterium]|nr:bifunctional oligoribonuclease/PAP phosphatase NrnA [Clostridiaceae bacterium]
MIFNSLASEINKAESIAILPHISADGDGLGSSFALGLALRKMNKQIKVFLEEPIPFIYDFLPGKELTGIITQEPENCDIEYDLAIALDTGSLDRLGKRAAIFKNSRVTLNIDHHSTNSEFAHINYVRAEVSSVGEIIYRLLNTLNVDIDRDIAACLYVSISTDTGGFRYSNTKPETHRIAAELIEKDINVSEISQRVFETNSLEKVKLMAHTINSLQLFYGGKVAVTAITDEIIKSVGAKDEDSEGLVNIARSIQGVEVAVMLKENSDHTIKVNLRSNNYIDVAAVANHFSGGGHKRAAGCIIKASLEEAKTMLLDKIKNVLMS